MEEDYGGEAMIEIRKGEHVGLVGTNGSGKTYYFRHVFEPNLRRLIVIDTEERQFNDLPVLKGDPMKIIKKLPDDRYFRLRWIPTASSEIEDMELFAQSLIYFGDDLQIYIDELTDFSSANSIRPWLKSLFRKARKRKISIYWASQRPAGVNKWAWDNSSHKLLFYIRDYDRTVLDKYYRGISEELNQIEWKSYRCLYIDPSGATHLMEAAGR